MIRTLLNISVMIRIYVIKKRKEDENRIEFYFNTNQYDKAQQQAEYLLN